MLRPEDPLRLIRGDLLHKAPEPVHRLLEVPGVEVGPGGVLDRPEAELRILGALGHGDEHLRSLDRARSPESAAELVCDLDLLLRGLLAAPVPGSCERGVGGPGSDRLAGGLAKLLRQPTDRRWESRPAGGARARGRRRRSSSISSAARR